MDRSTKFTALYERLSHDDELQGDSFSIIHQKELLTEYSRSHGFLNVRHFTDDGISGTRFDRPGFLQLMKEVETGHVSCICVKDACVIIEPTRKGPFERLSWPGSICF